MDHDYGTIAIIRLSSLGDIVHALPAFQLVRKTFPRSKISWFVEPAGAPLLGHFRGIDEVIVINLKVRGLKNKFQEINRIKQLYSRRFDLIIDLQGLLKSAFITRLLKNHSIGFHKKNLRESLAARFYHETAPIFDETKHVIFKNIHLLKCIGIQDLKVEYPLKPLTASPRLVGFLKNQNLENRHFVLFNIGGGWESKILPPENQTNMVKRLTIDHPVVVLWGNEREKKTADRLTAGTDAIMAPPTDFNDLILLIQKARTVISGDTLALHIADMVKTPSVGLFGPTNPSRNGSLLPNSRSVYKKLDCGFCYQKKCDKMDCMKAITAHAVETAVAHIHEKHN